MGASNLFAMIDSIDRGEQSAKRAFKVIADPSQDESGDPPYKALTRDEAQALRAKQPMISPWRVVGAQALVGLVCVAFAWGFVSQGNGHQNAAWSALYGAAAVVLPSALLARGMTRRADSPTAAAMGLMFWETIKIAAAIAMLVIAARVVPQLNWPALLVTMVVCSQMNWFALLWRGR
jgi:ATP synthase protein I